MVWAVIDYTASNSGWESGSFQFTVRFYSDSNLLQEKVVRNFDLTNLNVLIDNDVVKNEDPIRTDDLRVFFSVPMGNDPREPVPAVSSTFTFQVNLPEDTLGDVTFELTGKVTVAKDSQYVDVDMFPRNNCSI